MSVRQFQVGPKGQQVTKWGYDFLWPEGDHVKAKEKRRYRKVVGDKRDKAAVAEAEEKKCLAAGVREAKASPFFAQFADQFLEEYSKTNKESWGRDAISLERLKKFFGDKRLDEIGLEHINRYKARRRTESSHMGPKISKSTVNRELAALRTLFHYAVSIGRAKTNPVAHNRANGLRGVLFKEDEFQPRFLSDDEMQGLVEAAAPHLKPVFIVALATGMRKSELLQLRWSQVDFAKSIIALEKTKSKRRREIPIDDGLREVLKGLLGQSSEFVFHNPRTRRPLSNITTGFQAACERAGLNGSGARRVRIHDLRHSAASAMVRHGVDIVTIKDLLGHASLATTQRYVHTGEEQRRAAIERMCSVIIPQKAVLVETHGKSDGKKAAGDTATA